jgi:hypothetical protein
VARQRRINGGGERGAHEALAAVQMVEMLTSAGSFRLPLVMLKLALSVASHLILGRKYA